MRARNIKPGILKNEFFGTQDPLLHILFEGLWMIADREGRLEDRPLRIKAEVFPYREGLDINAMLTVISQEGFIERYVVNGKNYIQIVKFKEHQNPHHTEKKSIIPPIPNANGEITVNPPLSSSEYPADSLIPDSLIPDSLIPDSRKRGQISTSEIILPRSPKKINGSGRGTRLSPDWDLPDDWGEWAEKQGMTPTEIVHECDKFKDYWISAPGARASKANWEATWRNWIRRRLEDYAK